MQLARKPLLYHKTMKHFFLIICCIMPLATLHATDFNLLRRHLKEEVTLGKTDYDQTDPHIRKYLDQLAITAERYRNSMRQDTTFLWDDCNLLTDVSSFTPFHVHYSYGRLHTMARAWAYPGSAFYHEDSLLNDIRYGLRLLYRVAYNENTPMCGNWWEWRIGNTWDYANIVSILYEQLTQEEILQFERGASKHVRDYTIAEKLTYANQADVCLNLLMIGILTDSEQDIKNAILHSIPAFVDNTPPAVRAAANLAHDSIIRNQQPYQHFSIVWKKEGLYDDGTFIQHISIPYIGTYGAQIINLLASMTRIFKDTEYTIPDEILKVIPTWITKTYLPSIYKGEMMLMFMGRGNARDPYKNARICALNILDCAPLIADTALRRQVIHEMADMICYDKHYSSPYDNLDPLPLNKPRVDAAMLLTDGKSSHAPFSLVLAAGDRLIHETGKFRFGLAMSSNRIGKYEAFIRPTKSENNTGWYTGDGMTYIYTPNDPYQYYQYVPRINPYRIPGTTVDMLEREPCESGMILFDHQAAAADIARAGGVSLHNRYSSAMMLLLGSRSNLKAKKSWFCFDKEIICLGAGICLSDNREVITTVDNRQYGRRMTICNKQHTAQAEHAYKHVRYASIDSTGCYFFPKPVTLHANISNKGFNELWLSHGNAPHNASYAYYILPLMTENETKHYAHKPDVKVLRNDTAIQAVSDRRSGVVAINFWQSASLKLNHDMPSVVGSNAMAAMMLNMANDTLTIAVSEPTWLNDSLVLTLAGRFIIADAMPDNRVTLTYNGKNTILTINTHYRMGMTQLITLRKKQ